MREYGKSALSMKKSIYMYTYIVQILTNVQTTPAKTELPASILQEVIAATVNSGYSGSNCETGRSGRVFAFSLAFTSLLRLFSLSM